MQIPHFVRDDSFSSFSANCGTATKDESAGETNARAGTCRAKLGETGVAGCVLRFGFRAGCFGAGAAQVRAWCGIRLHARGLEWRGAVFARSQFLVSEKRKRMAGRRGRSRRLSSGG